MSIVFTHMIEKLRKPSIFVATLYSLVNSYIRYSDENKLAPACLRRYRFSISWNGNTMYFNEDSKKREICYLFIS